jgi:hAT family C-terminal dimerisation region
MSELDSWVKEVTDQLSSFIKNISRHLWRLGSMSSSSTVVLVVALNVRAQQEDDFYAYLKSRPVEHAQKSELEVYLEEPNYIKVDNVAFDVLKWWSQNCIKFPILSKSGRDIFCIPITTVASESVFSVRGRILDDYRSSLSKDMMKLLICGCDWIKTA